MQAISILEVVSVHDFLMEHGGVRILGSWIPSWVPCLAVAKQRHQCYANVFQLTDCIICDHTQ